MQTVTLSGELYGTIVGTFLGRLGTTGGTSSVVVGRAAQNRVRMS
jgi:hypothetical protein